MTPKAKNRLGFLSFSKFWTDSGQKPLGSMQSKQWRFCSDPQAKIKDEGGWSGIG
jgi:hypothetical protein